METTVSIKVKAGCVFCDQKHTMTIKAPYATPVRCCDTHRPRAWGMGGIAVNKNEVALEMLASPETNRYVRTRPFKHQAVIRAATDERLAEAESLKANQSTMMAAMAEMAELRAELAETQRARAENEGTINRNLADRAIEQAMAKIFQETSAMTRIRDRRRIKGA